LDLQNLVQGLVEYLLSIAPGGRRSQVLSFVSKSYLPLESWLTDSDETEAQEPGFERPPIPPLRQILRGADVVKAEDRTV
jgi:hypothetical protein